MICFFRIDESFYKENKNPHSVEHSAAISLLEYAARQNGLAALPEIMHNEHGKPYFARGDYHFNLSHCRGMAVCIFGKGENGVDIEKIGRYNPRIVKRIFTAAEAERLDSLPEEQKPYHFLRIWTRKEAYGKAIGTGVFTGLSGVDVEKDTEGFYSLTTEIDGYILSAFSRCREDISGEITEAKIFL